MRMALKDTAQHDALSDAEPGWHALALLAGAAACGP
jgi:hypothetical protein